MKFFGLIFILALASCHGAVIERTKRSESGSGLETLVEAIRETLINGDSPKGIPQLEPYESESTELEIDNSFAKLDGELTDLTVTGLTAFKVSSIGVAQVSSAALVFSYDLSWPKINVKSKYSVEGSVIGDTTVSGSGDVAIEIRNLKASGTVRVSHLGTDDWVEYLTLQSSSILVELGSGDFDFEITGLYNDDALSQEASIIVSEKVPQLIAEYSTEISSKINSWILDVGDNLVSTTHWNTLYDLLF